MRRIDISLALLVLAAACGSGDGTAPTQPGAASTLVVVAGNNQTGFGGAQLAHAITFKLADSHGTGVPNVAVQFSITAGEGSLAPSASTVLTDKSGLVSAPAWTLGKLTIPQELTASSGIVSAAAAAVVSTDFHAEMRFFGPPLDPTYQPAFSRALNRLNAEVIGQLAPVTFSNLDVGAACGLQGIAPLNEQITSLVIFVSIDTIAAIGGAIATSGPCYVRQSNKLAVVGTMLFDATALPAIAAAGQLDDVVFHEVQHVLGFGTLWATVAPVLIANAGTPQTEFTGALAIHGCQQAGGVTSDCIPAIPLESSGGPGTVDGHWRWSIFGNELMTAFLPAPGTPKLLSAMTIGSIADLGYQTNANVADAYLIPSAISESTSKLRRVLKLKSPSVREVILNPRFEIARDGTVSRLP